MALKSTKEMLELVQQAIIKLIGGAESVNVDGMSFKQTDLESLKKYELELRQRIGALTKRNRTIWPKFNSSN